MAHTDLTQILTHANTNPRISSGASYINFYTDEELSETGEVSHELHRQRCGAQVFTTQQEDMSDSIIRQEAHALAITLPSRRSALLRQYWKGCGQLSP